MIRCSIIILNWNGQKMLRRYLPSVLQFCPQDCEVVIADNGSTDSSLQVIHEFQQTTENLKLKTLNQNYGFAEGYNRAMAACQSPYVVLLNSDVEVTDNWLTPLLDYMDAHPEVVATQPKILSWKAKEEGKRIFEHAGAAGGYMDHYGYPYCRGRILSHVETDDNQYDTPADIFWATGAALCCRTAEYKRAGGLDATFFAHQEEIDLCYRWTARGFRLVCLPQSVVYHLGGGALGYESPHKTYLNFRNNLLMLYKNMPQPRLAWVLFCRFFMDYAALFQSLIKDLLRGTVAPDRSKPSPPDRSRFANSKAILRARFDFQRLRKHYRQARQQNIALTVNPHPATLHRRSIVLDYYLKGKRK